MEKFQAAKARLREAIHSNETRIDNWMNFPEKRKNDPDFKALYDYMIVLRYQYLDAISVLEKAEQN